MNIWLIDHYSVPVKYYPLARNANYAKNLMKMGHDVTIFAASTVHNSTINLIEDNSEYKEITDDGIRYVLIRCHGYFGNGAKRILNMYEFAYRLGKVCDKYSRPDAIVATSMTLQACKRSIQLGQRYGCRKVAQITDLWPESIVEYGYAGPHHPMVVLFRRIEKWIYKNADTIIFSFAGGYQSIIENGWEKEIPREKSVYINNGVDLEAFEYNKEHYTVEDAELNDSSYYNIVYTGSIRLVNDLSGILEVAKCVKNPRVRFLIWGTGDQLDELKKRVSDEEINNVYFKGWIDKKYIPYIVSKAFINYAHNQPSPLFKYGISFNKIFDYLAAGRPILCDFPCPYNPVIMGGAGVSVDSADPSEIASQIDSFIEMDPDKLKELCSNATKTSKDYDFQTLTQKLLDVINGICNM